MNRTLNTVAACGAALLLVAGCGSDTDSADTTASVATTLAPTATVAPTLLTVPIGTSVPASASSTPVTTVAATTATTIATTTTAAPRVVSSPSDNVRKGDTGPGVEQIQTALKAAGYDLEADGIFGQITDAAVRDYQKENGLTVDGIVGPNTWAKLGSAATATTTAATTTTTG